MHTDVYTTLIEPVALAARLADPEVAILDCRYDLARPHWGREAYAEAHIPGALYAHLDRDLSGPITAHTGRHPLPSADRLAATLSRWGVDRRVQVVAYDQQNGAVAARLWWLLRWLGQTAVAVLDGGFAAWQAAGFEVTSAPSVRAPREFSTRPEGAGVVSTEELVAGLARDDVRLVDARAPDRFAGHNETLDPVAGHVPGAKNHPFASNLDPQGRFLAAPELRRRWRATLGERPPEALVAMCGSGVTACHNLLALEVAGLPGGRLYAGSWSEWIRDPRRPVARDSPL